MTTSKWKAKEEGSTEERERESRKGGQSIPGPKSILILTQLVTQNVGQNKWRNMATERELQSRTRRGRREEEEEEEAEYNNSKGKDYNRVISKAKASLSDASTERTRFEHVAPAA